jgi:hypothetical protein
VRVIPTIPMVLAAVGPIYLVWHSRYARRRPKRGLVVPREYAVEAIDKMKDWATWLTGLALGAISAIGALMPRRSTDAVADHSGLAITAAIAVALLGMSAVTSSFLLCALPSLHLRLRAGESADNDIYEASIYHGIGVRLGAVAVLQHSYFIGGAAAFAFYVYSLLFSR